MRQYSQMNFQSLRSLASRSQRRGQAPLETRDAAFGLGALTVDRARERSIHFSSISCLGPAPSAAFVQVDDSAVDPQLLPRYLMVLFRVIAGVGQHTIQAHAAK